MKDQPTTTTQSNLTKSNHTYSDVFGEIEKLSEADCIVHDSCRFCLHPERIAGEELYEKTKSIASVEKFFREYESAHPDFPKMTIQSLKKHLLKHYAEQEKNIYIREYAKKCKAWMNRKISEDKRLDSLMAQMEMKLIEIASDPKIDITKQSETMTKLAKSIMDIMTMQKSLRGDVNSVQLVVEKVTAVWEKTIDSQQNDLVKKQLFSALEDFQEKLNAVDLEVEN